MNIVDRRPNPKGKSLSNRQRFLARARAEVKSAVQDALRKRKVADVELPDRLKKSLKETFAVDLQRAGYTVTGSPANLSIRRTMRNSMARRISLKRPKQSDLEALREAIENARARGADEEAERLMRELDRLEHRSKIIP